MHLCLCYLWKCICVYMCVDLEHNWSLLLCIDGDTGAGHPGIGAQVPEPHIRVSEEGWDDLFTAHLIFICMILVL